MKHPQADVLIPWLEDTSRVVEAFAGNAKNEWIRATSPLVESCNNYILRLAPPADQHAANKALYAIDASHCTEPWKLWEFNDVVIRGSWLPLVLTAPSWSTYLQYRRRADAPVWVETDGFGPLIQPKVTPYVNTPTPQTVIANLPYKTITINGVTVNAPVKGGMWYPSFIDNNVKRLTLLQAMSIKCPTFDTEADCRAYMDAVLKVSGV